MGAVRGGGERILVVDDDPVQRDVLTTLPGRLGYDVASVESGEAALAHLEREPRDLLVLDMVMPGMDGAETLRRVQALAPGRKAVLLSGYAASERVAEARRFGAGPFLRKPIALGALAEAVRAELDRGPRRPRKRG